MGVGVGLIPVPWRLIGRVWSREVYCASDLGGVMLEGIVIRAEGDGFIAFAMVSGNSVHTSEHYSSESARRAASKAMIRAAKLRSLDMLGPAYRYDAEVELRSSISTVSLSHDSSKTISTVFFVEEKQRGGG